MNNRCKKMRMFRCETGERMKYSIFKAFLKFRSNQWSTKIREREYITQRMLKTEETICSLIRPDLFSELMFVDE